MSESETPQKKGFWKRFTSGLLGQRESAPEPVEEKIAEPVAPEAPEVPEPLAGVAAEGVQPEAIEPQVIEPQVIEPEVIEPEILEPVEPAVPEPLASEVLEPAAEGEGESAEPETSEPVEIAEVITVLAPAEDAVPKPAEPAASEPVGLSEDMKPEALEPAEEAVPATFEPEEPVPAQTAVPEARGFWKRLTSGLARTAASLTQGITDLVSKRKLDAETLEDLEDILIRADLGIDSAARIVAQVGRGRHDKMISPEEVKQLIAAEVETILAPVAVPLVVDTAQKPFILLMVGVNGSGKTTTIGKLAAQWRAEGRKVVVAAGDTFRAAAIEQLKVWGERTGAHVIARAPGADAAGVAHDAITEARALGADILMIDTAGRLQNRAELMAELEKVVRVIRKLEPSAPHAVLLVLDATVGQNALSQVEVFKRVAGVTGLVMTKLDGTARGGILVAISAKHGLPVHLIGVGEGANDLQPFAARDFARAIAGLD